MPRSKKDGSNSPSNPDETQAIEKVEVVETTSAIPEPATVDTPTEEGAVDTVEKVSEGLSSPMADLEKSLWDFPVEHIKVGEYSRDVTDQEVQTIVENVRTGYGVSYRTSLNGICEMIRREMSAKGAPPSIRRGMSAKGAPPSSCVEIYCPDEGTAAIFTKRDVDRLVELVCKGRRSLRDLVKKLAPFIVRTGLRRQMVNPSLDMSGDLAKKINNRLVVRQEEPLTSSERVGCASYAQDIVGLDKLCSSNRLARLLAEDLELRKKGSQNPKNKGKGSNEGNKGKGKKSSNNKSGGKKG